MKCLKVLVVFLITVLSITAGVSVVMVTMWLNGYYLPWAEVPKGIQNEEQLEEYCRKEITQPLILRFKDGDVNIVTDDFMRINISVTPISFSEYLVGSRPEVFCSWEYNETKIIDMLKRQHYTYTNAEIRLGDDGKFNLVKENLGHDFNIEELKHIVIESMRRRSFLIEMDRYCTYPTITKKDLQSTYNSLSWVNDWCIEYTSGSVIDSRYLKNCWDENFVFNIDNLDVEGLLSVIKQDYDTSDSQLNFKTSNGTMLNIPYSTFGIHVNENREIQFIKDSLSARASVSDRTPITYGYNKFSNTYIEVSIGQQHVWHYVNGALCCETDCVTGMKGQHDTPIGVFYVSEKINGKYLKGDDYKTWVNKWMRLNNQGIGLHDAYWRGRFGTDLYITNGSHGCINLPKRYAYNLYDEISVGLPVVVY